LRRRQYGVVQDERGLKVVVKQRVVAAALSQAQDRIEALERTIQQGKAWDERKAKELKERTDALAALQNHWWTRLGEMLHVIRIARGGTPNG
jgi:hypothetical protein